VTPRNVRSSRCLVNFNSTSLIVIHLIGFCIESIAPGPVTIRLHASLDSPAPRSKQQEHKELTLHSCSIAIGAACAIKASRHGFTSLCSSCPHSSSLNACCRCCYCLVLFVLQAFLVSACEPFSSAGNPTEIPVVKESQQALAAVPLVQRPSALQPACCAACW
jgi:hypothetical protein